MERMTNEEFEVFRYEFLIQVTTFLLLMLTFIFLFISFPVAIVIFFAYFISLLYLLKKLKIADENLRKKEWK